MSHPVDRSQEFDSARARQLLELLKSRQVLPEAEVEALVYALTDIDGSIEKAYSKIIPTTLSEPDAPMEVY